MLLLSAPALSEVLETGNDGFTVRTVMEVSASPETVFSALVDDLHLWWHPDHTFSGDAANLYLEAQAGGIFGERLPDGGSVRHLDVLFVQPGKLLRLSGGLGPFQGMAVSGALTVELKAVAGGTQTTMTYAVGGYAPEGLADTAAPVDAVLAQQMERLKAHLEN